MGDLNLIIRESKDGNIVRKYALGKRTERGSQLLEFWKKLKLVIGNII